MDAQHLQNKFKSHPILIELMAFIASANSKQISLKGLAGSSASMVFSLLFKETKRSFLLVLNDREQAAYLFDDLSLLISETDVLFFPASYKRIGRSDKIEQENIVQRTEVLNRLSGISPCVVVTYPEALLEKVISAETLTTNTLQISLKERVSIDFISEVLHEYGFERVDFFF